VEIIGGDRWKAAWFHAQFGISEPHFSHGVPTGVRVDRKSSENLGSELWLATWP
jgi:hypothetical protein